MVLCRRQAHRAPMVHYPQLTSILAKSMCALFEGAGRC